MRNSTIPSKISNDLYHKFLRFTKARPVWTLLVQNIQIISSGRERKGFHGLNIGVGLFEDEWDSSGNLHRGRRRGDLAGPRVLPGKIRSGSGRKGVREGRGSDERLRHGWGEDGKAGMPLSVFVEVNL